MSTINFNLKNKNNQQIKNEVLSKMLKIKDKYDNDANYYDLFYNVVQNSTSKNNMKLSIQKDGNFNLQYGGNNKQNSYGWVNTNFELLTNSTKNQSYHNYDDFEDNNDNQNNDEEQSSIDNHDIEEDQSNDIEEDQSNDNEEDQSNDNEEDQENDNEQNQSNDDRQIQVNEEETGKTHLSHQEKKKQFEQSNNCSYSPGWFSSKPNCKSIEEKMNNEITNGQFGGYDTGSEYESDASYFSSDEEDEFVPIMTTLFDDNEDEDDMMDHFKNMKSTKYLKNLHTNELRQILKDNNSNVSKNNKYLTKDEMIKSIKKIYKN